MLRSWSRTRFDQFGKQMIRAALATRGPVETDAEVPADTRRIDLWFMPDPTREAVPDHLGLLGRLTAGPSTFELFHNTPNGDELAECLIKHGQFRHFLSLRDAPPPIPTQWVISSGRPGGGIEGLWLRPIDGSPGIYEGPPLLWTRLVVVSELPATRDTLLLRLLGAGRVLRQAVIELKALPAKAPERALALPILLRLRVEVPTNPRKQMNEADEQYFRETEEIVENWRREAIQEGVQQGIQEGVQQGIQHGAGSVLLRQLRQRFGSEVDADVEQRIAAAPIEQLEIWAGRVLTAATLAELLAD